eukprot:TRINITY_DN17564_c0_g1_i1.p2 TRINITY_DN17564_c0_g1~~TRINITY_DN17564_c0_g1_i1.p2  ORF type:complete len:216 (-),score=54.78 TRINITY_DN17564_c0_g1_i1:131-718(-)
MLHRAHIKQDAPVVYVAPHGVVRINPDGDRCHRCGAHGHHACECPSAPRRACFACGAQGHTARDCGRTRETSAMRQRCEWCGLPGHAAAQCFAAAAHGKARVQRAQRARAAAAAAATDAWDAAAAAAQDRSATGACVVLQPVAKRQKLKHAALAEEEPPETVGAKEAAALASPSPLVDYGSDDSGTDCDEADGTR